MDKSKQETKKPKTLMKAIRFSESEKPLFDSWSKETVKEIKALLKVKLMKKSSVERIMENKHFTNSVKVLELKKIVKDLFYKQRCMIRWNAKKETIEKIETNISLIYDEINILKGLTKYK